MKNVSIIFLMLISSVPAVVLAQKSTADKGKIMNNKELVQQKFKQWEDGTGTIFDLLDEHVEWTMTGNSPISGVWHSKQQYSIQVVTPINKKLKTRLFPKLLNIYQDGEILTVLWESKATAKDGKPYQNQYCWILTMKDSKIVKIVAYLDTFALSELMTRTPAKIFESYVITKINEKDKSHKH